MMDFGRNVQVNRVENVASTEKPRDNVIGIQGEAFMV